jgi:excisionase family DNA binding protein
MLMTTHEVAEMLRVHERTIRRLHIDGMLVGIRMGRGDRSPLRFRREDVEAFLAAQKGR